MIWGIGLIYIWDFFNENLLFCLFPRASKFKFGSDPVYWFFINSLNLQFLNLNQKNPVPISIQHWFLFIKVLLLRISFKKVFFYKKIEWLSVKCYANTLMILTGKTLFYSVQYKNLLKQKLSCFWPFSYVCIIN